MRVSPAFAAVLLGLLVAGCTDDAGSADDGEDGGDDGPAVLDPPTWEVGQSWSYTGGNGDFTLVVSEDAGSDYITDTDNEELALFDAQEDVSFLGPIGKSDLSGDQGGQTVRFFQWPLQDGATWSATWDGVERRITAAAQEDGTFRMTATEDGRTTVTYVYDPEAAWITSMAFFDENGTENGFRMVGSGTGYSGELQRWSIDEAVLDGSWGGPGAASTTFAVGDEVTFLEYKAAIDCADATTGQHTLQMGLGEDPGANAVLLLEQDPPVDMAATCPDEAVEEERLEARAGEWVVRSNSGSDGGSNAMRVDLLTRETWTL